MTHPKELDEIRKQLRGPVTEEVLEKAVSHRLGLEIFLRGLFMEAPVSKEFRPFAEAALRRQALASPVGKQRYDERLLGIVGTYRSQFVGSVSTTLKHVALLESFGFCYEDPRKTSVCLVAIRDYVNYMRRMICQLGPNGLSAAMAFRVSQDTPGYEVTHPETSLSYARLILHAMQCGVPRPHATPVTSPEVLQAVVSVTLQRSDDRGYFRSLLSGGLTSTQQSIVISNRLVEQLHVLSCAGMSDEQMRVVRERHGAEVLALFAGHVHSGRAVPDQFNELIALGALEMKECELGQLLEQWNAAGQPGTLALFKDIGGTKEDWERHLSNKRNQRAQELETGLAQREKRLRSMMGSGKKRRHTSYVPPQPKTINFDTLERQLEVHSLFSEFDEACVRAVIVRGFLKHGDRLPKSLHEAEQRDLKKLWKATRTLFGSRREFNALLSAMEKAHVVLRKGGKYQLHWPGARFPEARAQVLEIKKLLARA